MDAPEELNIDRTTFIGGSDAAAILGVSPWATPLDVFLEKIGEPRPPVDPKKEKLFRRGKREEPRIVDDLIEDFGIKVTKRSSPEKPNRYHDQEHDFLAAEIDYEWEVTPQVATDYGLPDELIGTTQNGEVKTVHQFAAAKFGEAETDEVPIEYAAQAMHGLMVTGRQLTMFAVRIGFEIVVYWIRRDDDTVNGMRAKLVAFWREHVLTRTAPAAIRLPDIYELFTRVPAIRIEASSDVVKMVNELENLRGEQRAAAQGEEEIKFRIGEFLLGKDAIVIEGGKTKPGAAPKNAPHVLTQNGLTLLEVGLQVQNRLDGDKVKKDHPAVAAACQKSISFYKFAKPRKKK